MNFNQYLLMFMIILLRGNSGGMFKSNSSTSVPCLNHVHIRNQTDDHIEQDYFRFREDIFIDDYLHLINPVMNNRCQSPVLSILTYGMNLSTFCTSYFENIQIFNFNTSYSHHSNLQYSIDDNSYSIFPSIKLSCKEILVNICIFLTIVLSSLVIIIDIRKKDSTISFTFKKHRRTESAISKKNTKQSQSMLFQRHSCIRKPDLETIFEEYDIVSSVF